MLRPVDNGIEPLRSTPPRSTLLGGTWREGRLAWDRMWFSFSPALSGCLVDGSRSCIFPLRRSPSLSARLRLCAPITLGWTGSSGHLATPTTNVLFVSRQAVWSSTLRPAWNLQRSRSDSGGVVRTLTCLEEERLSGDLSDAVCQSFTVSNESGA